MEWIICGVDDAEWRIGWATHVVSILQPTLVYRRLNFELPPSSVLALDFDDVGQPGVFDQYGYKELVPPDQDHIERLVEFADRLLENSRVLVHCEMGASRSPAAAYILMCARYPKRLPRTLLKDLVEEFPNARPNPLMVRLADGQLQRKGQMIKALEDLQGN